MKLKILTPNSICRSSLFLFCCFVLFMTNSAIGQITINKTVVQQNICNQFNVNLSITGVSSPAPLDAILVIDKSGSMTSGSPSSMSYAKTAAINFVRKVFSAANNPGNINRIGLVSFSTTASLDRQLSFASDSTLIINAINAMVANGSTNISDGFYQAGKEMKARARLSCNVIRSIVLFTDGVANEGSTYNSSTDHYAGTSCASAPTSPTACTNQAYLQGQAAQSFTISSVNYPTKVFTVGLFGGISGATQTLAENTLNSAQNSGFFQTESAADLNGIFGVIVAQLQWAAQAIPGFPMVTDTIGSGFVLIPGSLVVSQGTATNTGQNIAWNMPQVNNGTVTLSYSVNTQNASSCGIHKISNSWMHYLDPSCAEIKIKFPNPDVCVPCTQVSQVALSQTGCGNTISYSSILTVPEVTCNAGQQFYSWVFTMNSVVVGTANGLSGTFVIPSQFATPTCNGSIKGVLSYNSGSGCTLVLGEFTLNNLVIDNSAPVISTPAGSLNITVSCASDVPPVSLTAISATDNCSGGVTISHVGDVTIAGSCANKFSITRTYRATDACGNHSDFVQVITVNDNIAPVISTVPGSLNLTVSCASDVPAVNLGAISATDNCSGVVTISHLGDVTTPGSCANKFTITRTYRATDVCGNHSDFVQVITVNDNIAPVISTVPGSLNLSVSCASDVPAVNLGAISAT
ncbi:MAG: vWA domain-containing protein, partial [Bacteroidota bacterium]